MFAVAHTLVVIIWHVLAEATTYDELGADSAQRRPSPPALLGPRTREARQRGDCPPGCLSGDRFAAHHPLSGPLAPSGTPPRTPD